MGYLDGLGIYNITCGRTDSPCPARPNNPEAQVFEKAFANWKNNFVIDLEKGSLVVDEKDGRPGVHSEGMAYGLYFALFAGDQKTFDKLLNGLENYAKKGNGLYSWKLNTKGTVLQKHSAADADMYAAAAATLAYAKWKDPRHQKVAQRLIDAIWEKEILELGYKQHYIIKPSDNKKWFVFGDGRFVYNPSYFAPSLLRIFASVDKNPKHDWNKVIDDGYLLLEEIIRQNKKLRPNLSHDTNPVPDWVEAKLTDKSFYLDKYFDNPHKGFDAIRVYLELARDRDPRAQRIADLILNKIPFSLTPQRAKLAGSVNEPSTAYYGLLFLTSSRSPSIGKHFISELRKYYQKQGQQGYYFQSLLLHATTLLGGYTFKTESLKNLFPSQDYSQYIPFAIYAKKDGSVYVDDTLIYQYTKSYESQSPYQRAKASVDALEEAYLDDHLRPKYLEKENDPESGAMVVNYYLGLSEENLFKLGPADLGKSSDKLLGYGNVSGLYRYIFGVSHEDIEWLNNYEEEKWYHTVAQFTGIKARKNPLEYNWDEAYNLIYQKLIESGLIDFRKEAERKLEHPTPATRLLHFLPDSYALTKAAHNKEKADHSRTFDDKKAVKKFIKSFLAENPLAGFSAPVGYTEALFSLATILADQEGRYGIDYMQDALQEIETQVKSREKQTNLPIDGLADSKSYFGAALKIIETIVQSKISNFGFKSRALREKADLNFRIREKGKQLFAKNPLPIPSKEEIVGDYLTALELRKNQFNLSGLVVGNWRKNPSHLEVMKKVADPEYFYGLAAEYTQASYKPEEIFLVIDYGDMFELAKIAISLGTFYLFETKREKRFEEITGFDEVDKRCYQGLKEAETWFKFVAHDPQGIFKDKHLNPYKIEALVRLGEVQTQLALLELAKNKKSKKAFKYFKAALRAAEEAYEKVTIEFNLMPAKDRADEGVSMNLRVIYFNVLIRAASIKLEVAKNSDDPNKAQKLIDEAYSYAEEALQNRELIIFATTKRKVYETVSYALKWLAQKTPAKDIPVAKMVSILEIDTLTENNDALRELQLLALALLIYHCLKTTSNLKQAEKKFAKLFPWEKINRPLRISLGLQGIDLASAEEPLKLLIQRRLPKRGIPIHIQKDFEDVI